MASNTDRGDLDPQAQNGTYRGRGRMDDASEHGRSAAEAALSNIQPGEVIAQVETFARANPHLALAGAAALGFVLGGGLTPRLVGAVGMIAARRYMQGAMKESLDSFLKGV